MKLSSLYIMKYSHDLSIYVPINIPLFNDKRIKKISLNCKTLNVLTYDGMLYQIKSEELNESKN